MLHTNERWMPGFRLFFGCVQMNLRVKDDSAFGIAMNRIRGHNWNRLSSPMDVMMKSSLSIRRIRIVERPYDIPVTDSTPGKECTSSASYGLGQIPDKGRSDHSAGKPRIEACPKAPTNP